MNHKISPKRKKKEEIVNALAEKITKAKSLVFTNYQGLTHKQLEGLKKTAKKLQAEYITTKNTLLKRALKDKIDLGKEEFAKPTATLFIYNDIVAPMKELAKTIKELNLPKIKFGILEGKILAEAEIHKIATLPPVPVLRAQLVGQMQAPISGLHRALSWNMQRLVLTLNAIKVKKI